MLCESTYRLQPFAIVYNCLQQFTNVYYRLQPSFVFNCHSERRFGVTRAWRCPCPAPRCVLVDASGWRFGSVRFLSVLFCLVIFLRALSLNNLTKQDSRLACLHSLFGAVQGIQLSTKLFARVATNRWNNACRTFFIKTFAKFFNFLRSLYVKTCHLLPSSFYRSKNGIGRDTRVVSTVWKSRSLLRSRPFNLNPHAR